MFSWIGKTVGLLFGSSSNGKGVVGEISDTIDRWNPSPVTEHKMNIEDQQAGDESQNSARNMKQYVHESWLDIFVDAMNRLPRPVITGWVIGGLIGWWELPRTGDIDPFMQNIIWTVITFWFGSRVIFKDVPRAIQMYKGLKNGS